MYIDVKEFSEKLKLFYNIDDNKLYCFAYCKKTMDKYSNNVLLGINQN